MAEAEQLAATAWRAVAIADQTVPVDEVLFIRFEENGKVAGNGGCNNFFGAYRFDAVNLAIGPLGRTRRMCPPPIMKREAAFLQALEKTRLFLRDGAKLTLKDAQGVTLLRLAQSAWH